MEQTQKYDSACVCEPDECDTFKFMAKRLGMSVLHPGGLEATEILAKRCSVSEDKIILDAGCGSGSTSIFLAKRFGCKVIGVDVDHNLLMKANSSAQKENLTHKTAFRYADIQNLPFQDGTFDGASGYVRCDDRCWQACYVPATARIRGESERAYRIRRRRAESVRIVGELVAR